MKDRGALRRMLPAVAVALGLTSTAAASALAAFAYRPGGDPRD